MFKLWEKWNNKGRDLFWRKHGVLKDSWWVVKTKEADISQLCLSYVHPNIIHSDKISDVNISFMPTDTSNKQDSFLQFLFNTVKTFFSFFKITQSKLRLTKKVSLFRFINNRTEKLWITSIELFYQF